MSEPNILYEDNDILILDKPAGMLVHGIYYKGEARHAEQTLVDWVVARYPEIKAVGDSAAGQVPHHARAGIVHRLDRETSGVMVIAKNQETFAYLKKLFQSRDIQKTYVALVWGRLKGGKGTINKPISIVDGSVKRTVFKGKMTREAITEYTVIKHFHHPTLQQEFTLLEVRPRTGRTHQIRVHLSSLGHPVVGDKLYGKQGALPGLDRHFLHAKTLELSLPSGKHIAISASLPAELVTTLDQLNESESE